MNLLPATLLLFRGHGRARGSSVLLLLLLFTAPSGARAATLTVTTLNDSGAGSLRQAITNANAAPDADTITFSVAGVIALAQNLPAITNDVTITGPAGGVTISGSNAFTDMIIADGTVNLNNFTIAGGQGAQGFMIPGGILVNGGTVVMRGMTFRNNRGGDSEDGFPPGPGAVNVSTGDVTLINCTLSGNVGGSYMAPGPNGGGDGDGAAGGAHLYAGRLVLVHCTVSGNKGGAGEDAGGIGQGGDGGPGGLLKTGGTLMIANTIVAGNTGGAAGDGIIPGQPGASDMSGGVSQSGNNITAVDPVLGPLADNGGPTQTRLPKSGSQAINGGDNLTTLLYNVTTDQRGQTRIVNGTVDIGAVEVDPPQSDIQLTVTTLDDHDDGTCGTNDCSLREAINAANADANASTISFAPTVNGTMQLNGALPDITADTTLLGPGARLLEIHRNTSDDYRIFDITPTADEPVGFRPTVAISGLTISNGLVAGNGGGVRCYHGNVTVSNCTVTGNGADQGGALSDIGGALVVSQCTLSGNNSYVAGGGAVYIEGSAPPASTTITNCTLGGNSALNTGSGGAVYCLSTAANATITLDHCTLAGNSAASGSSISCEADDGSATVKFGSTIFQPASGSAGGDFAILGSPAKLISQGYNLSSVGDGAFLTATTDTSGVSPRLAPLANNGGPTDTRALLPGSPALNTADPSSTLTQDQRGQPRPSGAGPDIGAFELTAYSLDDVRSALKTAAELAVATQADLNRLNTEYQGPSRNVIDIADAVRITRKATGLEINP